MRVAVLGGGYAGLLTTRRLERSLPEDVELVVVDDTGDHLVQHELHRAVRVPAFADAISIPLSDLLRRATVRTETVDAVDRDRREVALAGGERLAYDVCVVALGADTAFYGIEGVREHATPLKRLDHAAAIRERFLDVVDAARAGDAAAEASTVVVGGAGLAGVQVAGELAAFAEEAGVADAVDVVVLERLDDVAPSFPAEFRTAVRDLLTEAGVELRTGTTVAGATAEAVELASGETLAYDQFVWTGGIAGSAAMGGDRPRVRATLALDERTFLVGDAARVVDADGEGVPATAQAAVRAAAVAARNVAEVVAAEREGYDPRLEQWRFDSPGWLVSVGDDAVAQVGPQVFTGRLANVVKSSVGVGYLAEHGSLRDALELLRTEVDGPAELFSHLPDGDERP
jgi:NADH dehydrogenase